MQGTFCPAGACAQAQACRDREHVERFFNKLKQFRRIATRHDKLGTAFLAFIQLAAVRIWLRSMESTT